MADLGSRSSIKSTISNRLETGVANTAAEFRQSFDDVVDSLVHESDLSTVATTGSYNDLSDKPDTSGAEVDDTAYGVSWDGETAIAPSQNAVYDQLEAMQTDIDGKLDAAVTITAGTGLTGGGDLSANRTVALDAGSIASLALADTATQPGDLATIATTGSFNDIADNPVSSTAYGISWSGDTGVATKGVLYTKIEALDSEKSDTGHTHVKADITDFTHTHVKADITDLDEGDYATAAQGSTADSAVQPSDLISGDANNTLSGQPKFWVGTQANYDALGTYDSNTFYEITD